MFVQQSTYKGAINNSVSAQQANFKRSRTRLTQNYYQMTYRYADARTIL
jgi:hypothetical protein